MPEYEEPEVAHNEADDIYLMTDDVQDILSEIPHWVVRYGMTVVFASVGILIMMSFVIKYPDIINSRIVLTTEVPPTRVVARAAGELDLRVADNEYVGEETLLGVIENPANTEDVFALVSHLEPLAQEWKEGNVVKNLEAWTEDWQLGSLQPGYLELRAALLNFNRYQTLDFYTQQIATLQERIRSYELLNRQLDRQNTIYEQEVTITREQFVVDSTLYARQSLTERDYSNSRNKLLQTQRAYESSKAQVINNNIIISQLRGQITELQLNRQKEEDELVAAIERTLRNLESQVSAWKQQYLLQSPIAGQVTFSEIRAENMFVNVNDMIMTIVPDTSKITEDDLIGQVLAPVRNSGKLALGQRVNIRFDNYPSNEYGMVLGEVVNISQVPLEDFLSIQVRLDDGLRTTYKKDLEYRAEMTGTAQIITEDLRLIDRIFMQFRALIDRTSS